MRSWSRTASPRPLSLAARVVEAARTPPQPWKNGGGSTRELLAWPTAQDWRVRISMADIACDGPFSAFPGVDRWFAVVTGAGVVLTLDGSERRLAAGDAPFHFGGSAAPGCRLVDGPTRDLNLMVKGGRGVMRAVSPGSAWDERFAMRGLFSAVAGTWSAGGASRTLKAHTLVWDDAAEAGTWTFSPDGHAAGPAGWWLGFTL